MTCLIGAVVSVCPVCLVLLQYEQQMLPPRLEMEKLEDDIVKQVHTNCKADQHPPPPGLQRPSHLWGRQ